MLNIFENNTAFFHVPKCGGKSFKYVMTKNNGRIVQVVKPEAYQKGSHSPLSEIAPLIDLSSLDVIYTLVRNPLSLAVDLYFYVRQLSNKNIRILQDRSDLVLPIFDLDFPEYIDWYIENWISFDQWLMVNGKLPDNVVVLKLENIEDEMKTRFNNTKMPTIGMAKHEPYLSYYDESTIGKIYENDRWAFETFNYEVK